MGDGLPDRLEIGERVALILELEVVIRRVRGMIETRENGALPIGRVGLGFEGFGFGRRLVATALV